LLWTANTGSVIYDSSPAFAAGHVFVGCVNGTFNAIEVDTGKITWQYRLPPGHLLASPAADERRVYIGNMSGTVLALTVEAPKATAARE
jgi:outer membrane protein assembly factor BamB